MFDRWGLLVSLTQCCPFMDSPAFQPPPHPGVPAAHGEHPQVAGTTLTAYAGSLVQAAVREQTSSQQVGVKGTWLRGLQRGLLESCWGFLSPTFLPPPTSILWKRVSVAGFTHTTLPQLDFPGLCQWLAAGPSLQGRRTAVIKSLVEGWRGPNGTALWLWVFAWRRLSWTGSHSAKAP